MWLLQHVLGIHSNLLGNKSNLSAGYFFLLISLMPLISKYLLPMRLKPLTYSGKLLSVDRKCVFAHFYKAFFSPKTIIPRFRRFWQSLETSYHFCNYSSLPIPILWKSGIRVWSSCSCTQTSPGWTLPAIPCGTHLRKTKIFIGYIVCSFVFFFFFPIFLKVWNWTRNYFLRDMVAIVEWNLKSLRIEGYVL